jgi:cytochrome c-type biogenesis protein CcmH/NrfG
MKRKAFDSISCLVGVLVWSATYVMLAAVAGSAETPSLPPQYVGSKTCAGCHQKQFDLWQGSHHDLAMQPATPATVLGDFDNTRFTYFGRESRFFKRDNQFIVRTEGADGMPSDYPIAYTFGADPLQQYLVEFPGGRLQALSIAWDARPKEAGGQRWFHLYPDEDIKPGDELHWTGLNQNWNYMCADCHSTHLQKNYDPQQDRFDTTWAEINVACEACHGPGSQHLSWARQEAGWEKMQPDKGLPVNFNEPGEVRWIMDTATGTARRSMPRHKFSEIETCARCHSRRSLLSDDDMPGTPLMDAYLPSTLREGLYFPDGQIEGEVYVYGSFLQSKMYHAGVTCGNCHEPHSLRLRATGNGVCLQCHRAATYDRLSHHFHKPDSRGADCVACHMPARHFMVIDPRHDHSIRIPRPDLSVKLGVPNACNNCHAGTTAQWALGHVKTWYGQIPQGFQRYAEALADGRRGMPQAGAELLQLATNPQAPTIARATAFLLLPPYLNSQAANTLQIGLHDRDPLVRHAALGLLERVDPRLRYRLGGHLLQDRLRAVRVAAARVLAGVPREALTTEQRAVLDAAQDEYVSLQLSNADRPEAYLNLGNFYAQMGDAQHAEQAYRNAIQRHSTFTPGYVNLADLYRAQGRDEQAENVLQAGLQANPGSADLYHSMGLLRVRQNKTSEAVDFLARAAQLQPDNARYGYVYAIALHSVGKTYDAINVLKSTSSQHPHDSEVVYALATLSRDIGDINSALMYARRLSELHPGDHRAQQLIRELQK